MKIVRNEGVNKSMNSILESLFRRFPELECCQNDIEYAFEKIKETYANHGKLLICGNGGSSADSDHIVGELMKGFRKRRPISAEISKKLLLLNPTNGKDIVAALECGLPAISLSAHVALNTAFANDKNADMIYAQQVLGFGNFMDTFMGISTSGNSRNVLYAMYVAKAKGLQTIALTGNSGGKISDVADVAIIVPATETYQIQEYHLPIYHALCLMLEDEFYDI